LTVPAYNNDGILPPFLGPSPAHASGLMSPYKVTVSDIVDRFATSRERITILRGWLQHREGLRALGYDRGFQWLDGSFVEDKEPKDLDVVTFVTFGPPSFADADAAWVSFGSNQHLFDRGAVKAGFRLDAFFIDLLDPPELVVDAARYFLGLFSHQRITMEWKGMLQVRIEAADDEAAALVELESRELALPPLPPEMPINLQLFETGGPADAS